jgi:hypothetical protein
VPVPCQMKLAYCLAPALGDEVGDGRERDLLLPPRPVGAPPSWES